MTIYGSSPDPIHIKKIALKIWRLRDEIESIIQEAIVNNGGTPPENLDELIKVYTQSPQNSLVLSPDKGATLNLIPDAPLDNSEDEMAKALSGDNAETETIPDAPISDNVDEMAAAMGVPDAQTSAPSSLIVDDIVIKQTIPAIPQAKLAHGKTLLSEITMDQIFFFCDQHYMQGQSIVIEFLIPKKFVLNADIVYCRPYNMKSRIISAQKLPFRAVAKFTFLREGERTLLRSFLKSVEPDSKSKSKDGGGGGAKTSKENENIGDELDGLDDLL